MSLPPSESAPPREPLPSASPTSAKRVWMTPRCEELPPLTDLTMQQGSGIHGGGGGGGTVFPF